jgi:hypothetical protein
VNTQKAFKIIQDATDDLELTAQEHVQIGDAIVFLYDYITMIEGALQANLANSLNEKFSSPEVIEEMG